VAGELKTKDQRTQRAQLEVLPVSDARRVRESLAALTVFAIDVFGSSGFGVGSRWG